ncbi:hypothetical protein PPERSA_06596 [Pseudocohnilembus persalinus]|uniref:Tetratricopeptide repeat protein n=1 Tax=Pseudocohnilembus persalinus TaxID=266149 RepID=A0A0V0QRL6_PSEPJ|nr:hypothetical protein PPERSA_06596 [Pseudocohnilembus persalinus]|eukprot:KRX04962.1 hypothetical protein PPERSA_06596 [Pseudocohnilembus persalinus]
MLNTTKYINRFLYQKQIQNFHLFGKQSKLITQYNHQNQGVQNQHFYKYQFENKQINNKLQFQFSEPKLKFDENGVLIPPTAEEIEEAKKNKKFSFKLNRLEWLGVFLITSGIAMTFYYEYDEHIFKGNDLLEQKKFQEAIDHNKNSWFWNNLAISHYQIAIGHMCLNQYEDALREIDIALSKQTNFQTLRMKGHILLRMGEKENSKEYFQKSKVLAQAQGIQL